MLPIVNTYRGNICYLDLDVRLYCHICDDQKYHISGYFLFHITNDGLRFIGDIDEELITSIEINRGKLIISGVDELL